MWIAALIVIVVLGGVWVWINFVQTYHYAAVQPKVLYRDGFRTVREFNTGVNNARARTIVCLLDAKERENEPFAIEHDYCRKSDIKFVWISVPLGGWPTDENVKQFLETVQKENSQPVLVHCAQGVRRTGMMVAAYQMSVLGWDKERTKKAILTFGHSRRSIGDIEKFIDGYDPVSKTTVSNLPVGAE
jgi:protein tyrosine/serine phosphatase